MTQTVFTDTAGLIPATWGDAVARINDGKGLGGSIGPLRNSVQANSALRGSLGRAPLSRRNLLTLTEFQTGLAGAPVRAGLISTTTFSGLVDNTGLGIGHNGVVTAFAYKNLVAAPNTTYVFSVFVRMADGLAPVFSNTATLNDFALVVGGVLALPSTYTVQDIGGGLYRVSCTLTTASSISANNTGVLKNTTNTSRTFTTSGWQLELGSVATPYQRVRSNFDVTEANLPSPAYLRLDLVDDVIPWAAPDGLSGDVLVIGRNGSWIERAVTVASGGTLSVGPTTIAGRLPGILSAVGDIVAIIPIDRTMTAGEIDRLIAYYRPLGGRGLLVPSGPESVTNGTFDTDLSGWVNGDPLRSSVSWESGELKIDATAGNGNPPVAITNFAPLTAGRHYLISWDARTTDGATTTGIIFGSYVNAGGFSVAPQRKVVVRTTGPWTALNLYGSVSKTVFFDNISIRELTAS